MVDRSGAHTSVFWEHELSRNYDEEEWFIQIKNYLKKRYPPIANRLSNTFRYVDFHPSNKNIFSYEFASILRDIGSVFSSVLDSYVKGLGKEPQYQKNYDIRDYRDTLLEKIPYLPQIIIELNEDFENKYIIPFQGFTKNNIISFWWESYNAIKHRDIESLSKGCLYNVLYGFCALTILYLRFYHFPTYLKEMYPVISENIIRNIFHDPDLSEGKYKLF